MQNTAPTTTTTNTTTTTSSTVVTMTTTKFKDVILETIDQLRQRKARPDLERISHMLQRKHGISFSETEAILGKLVDSQVVFKVDYKGSTSYRNAAKWRINHLASSGGGGGGGGTGVLTQNSDQVSQKIREAVRALAGGGGNSSTHNSSTNNNNNTISNSSSSSSSNSNSSSSSSSGGVRRGRQQQQQQNSDNNSGVSTPSITAASSNKKSNSASTANLSTASNTFNHTGEREPSSIGATTKRGGSSVRADKASTHLRATSSEDKNNNSKSPAGGSVAPAATAAATISSASSSATASQASSTRRNSAKKEQTGPTGVSLKDLENWLNKQDSDNPLVKNLLVTALQREVQAGWLKRLRNGNYVDVASISNSNTNSKKKNTNNNKGTKNASGSSGAPTSLALASTPITSSSSVSTCGIVSPPGESNIGKNHPTTTVTTPNTNNNSIIIITNSANSSTNSATLITSSPSKSSFVSQPAKPNISHGTKRSASSVTTGPFLATSQPLISPSTPALIPTSDVTAHGQQGTTLVLVPSSSPTTSAAHPTLLLPVSPAQTSTDSDRRPAPLTASSASASSFSSFSLSSSSISASSGSNHHNNALARVSLSSSLSTPSMSTGTPGLSRESAPARRDNNNAKTAKSTALQTAGPTNAPVPAKRGRPASKRKRFKKTPGPEFETEDILKSEPEKCVTCSLTAQANKHGQFEELLVCKDCNTTVHPSCMDYCEELAARARNSPWQCIECKTCYVCDDSGDGVSIDSMLFCDACDKGYHMKCHVPRVEQKPKGKWVCVQCVSESGNSLEQPMEFEISNSEESRASSPSTTGICLEPMEASGPSCLPTPCDSPVQPDPEEKEIGREDESISLPMLRDFQGPYPDAANWTIDDVVNFFKSAGFVSQAEAFREQEIDGKSLLLMKRSDVLTGLSLKLGPALKMYTHVQNLQLVGQSSFVNGTGH